MVAWEVVDSWLLGLGCLENYLMGGMCSVDLVVFLKGKKRREEGGWSWSWSLSQTVQRSVKRSQGFLSSSGWWLSRVNGWTGVGR